MIKCTRNNDFKTFNLFTGKAYNFSDDLPIDLIKKQLDEVLDLVDYTFDKYICPKQKDTNIVKKVTLNNLEDEFVGVDGLITNLSNVALFTKVSDNQSILLYDPVNKVIGNIHSGINGTLNKIIVNAINIMKNDYNCNPCNIQVCIYPSLLKCCYEIDKKMVDMFYSNFDENIDDYIEFNENENKYHIDVIGINIKEMINLGIIINNIIISDVCTKCNSDDYYSSSADKEDNGKHLSIIFMK